MLPYAWAIEFGDGCHAFILDRAKAMDAAVRLHGIVRALFVGDDDIMETNPLQFIAAISAAAVASMAQTGVPASFTIAEGALESAWGTSQLALEGNNLFGVKADSAWHGDTLTMRTREFLAGQWVMVPALWRKYPDWQGCMDDHGAFLHDNNRYIRCFDATTGEAFATAVAAAGYATDPQYAEKLIETMRAHNLAQFDQVTA